MALPLIAAGVAAAASWFLSGCSVADEETQGDPCEGVDCSGHGACIPMKDSFVCVCERGYYQDGPECLADAPEDDAVAVADVEETPDETAENDADADAAIDPNQEFPYCDEQRCLDDRSYECKYTEVSDDKIVIGTRVVECNDEQVCQNGACVTRPDLTDPNCGANRRARCEVTDVADVYDENGVEHDLKTECSDWVRPNGRCDTDNSPYQCGDDGAFELAGNYEAGNPQQASQGYLSLAMRVAPQLLNGYLRVDVKGDWYYDESFSNDGVPTDCTAQMNPELDIQFGDGQHKIVPYSSSWQRCVYQGLAVFTPDGIEDGRVRIRLSNRGFFCREQNPTYDEYWDEYQSMFAVGGVRIWSCECFK